MRHASPLPLLALALALAFAPPAARGAAAGQEPGALVLLESAEGAVERVPAAELGAGDPRARGASLLRIEGAEPLELPALGDALAQARLVGGGRAHGRIVGGEGEHFTVELLGSVRLRVGVEELVSLRFPARLAEAEGSGEIVAPERGDLLVRRKGRGLDRIDGTLVEFGDEGVTFDSRLVSRTYPWDEVAALFVELLGEEEPAPTPAEGAAPVTVDLAGGSRLHARLLRVDGRGVALETPAGQGLRIPLGGLTEMLVEDGRLRFLSELAPARVEEASPFGDELGMRWPHQRDRSVGGGPLTVGGRVYGRGLGVHAPSRLTWELTDGWKSLRGSVGVDDEVQRLAARGSVRFRVHVDGEQRWESPLLRGGDGVLALPAIDLSGARELTLEVDPADELFVADRADWLRLVLVARGE